MPTLLTEPQLQAFNGMVIGFGDFVDMMTASSFTGSAIVASGVQGKTWLVGGYSPTIFLGSASHCFFKQDTGTGVTGPSPGTALPGAPGPDPPLPPIWPYPVGIIYQREYWAMNFQMIRLDTKVFDFVAYEGDDTVMNLTGATVRFTAKWDHFDADSAAVIKLDSAGLGGILITDAVNGKGTVTIPKTATSSLPIHRADLVYDLKVKKADATEHTIGRGILTIQPNATETI